MLQGKTKIARMLKCTEADESYNTDIPLITSGYQQVISCTNVISAKQKEIFFFLSLCHFLGMK